MIIKNALISIDLKNGITWGKATSLCKVKRENVRNNIASPLYKRNKVKDYYNSLTVICKDYNIEFRMYDDGMAYRFIGHSSDSITIDNEQSEVNFAKDFKAYVPYIINRSKKAGTPLDLLHANYQKSILIILWLCLLQLNWNMVKSYV